VRHRLNHSTVTRPQREFWDSDARFRAFTGGVGSGKTRLGCLSVFAQPPGSLGVVAAPTYPMLRDATLRTFLELARDGKVLAEFRSSDMLARLVNGSEVMFRSADDPDRLRGPNIGWFWLDEAAMMGVDVWNIMLGRLREAPGRAWLTTTPRGDNWIYDRWVRKALPGYAMIRSSSRDNPFLPPDFIANLESAYTSRFARQEIEGEFLLDVPGALWKRAELDAHRVQSARVFSRVVVGVDPKASAEADSETGIIVMGLAQDGRGYVLADYSIDGTPEQWAQRVAYAYEQHSADRVIVEVNQGGDMVSSVLRATGVRLPIQTVRAARGKYTRAEPIAALYEQGKVVHVGVHSALEDQLCTWTPGDSSPDRLDALCWAAWALMLDGQSQRPRVREY
jgi:phage terminase large subunit-like protein